MMQYYIKAPVFELSFDTYEKFNGCVDDDGAQMQEMIGEEERELYMKCLTRRQRQVADLLFSGYKRIEIAHRLTPPVCVQAIHQIILRIRKRLIKRAGITMKNDRIYGETRGVE
jgi:hypothetical protein